jgi:hypothetical protein
MRLLFVLLALFVSPAWSADGFSTVNEYQADFDKAHACKPIDGRKFWEGERAFYLQSWLFYTGQSGLLDDENADVLDRKDLSKEDITKFEGACK